jgi:ATP-dependent RNA helicase A
MMAPHQSMGLHFAENNQDNEISNLPYKRGAPAAYLAHLNQLSNRRMIQEAEETDVNAEMHGSWTIENAKSRLHQFLQMNKMKNDYKYSATGPEFNRSFFAEMTLFIPQINKSR